MEEGIGQWRRPQWAFGQSGVHGMCAQDVLDHQRAPVTAQSMEADNEKSLELGRSRGKESGEMLTCANAAWRLSVHAGPRSLVGPSEEYQITILL